jgi:phosphatidylserine/phosphatidylglycerophosphate/cardiolipin synthase-like enzyme
VICGAYNLTGAAEERNTENMLIFRSRELTRSYLENRCRHRAHPVKYRRDLDIHTSLRREISPASLNLLGISTLSPGQGRIFAHDIKEEIEP